MTACAARRRQARARELEPARPDARRVRLDLAQGPHELELEYFQIDGAWALIVELEPLP
jgi:hypothetical protein